MKHIKLLTASLRLYILFFILLTAVYILRSEKCDQFEQLTDFGLSKVGLINSTDDLSGPAVSGTSLMEEDEPPLSASEHQEERRKKRSAVGTPDYLAPEILLGTGHGWSIFFLLLYGLN